MADNNAQNPGYDWKPSGFLAGMWAGQDRDRYQANAGLEDQMLRNKAGISQEDFDLGGPSRQAVRQGEMEKTRGLAGVADRDAIANNYATRTNPSRGDAAIEKNEFDAAQTRLKKVEAAYVVVQNALLMKGPAQTAEVTQALKKAGFTVDRSDVRAILADPEQMNKQLLKMRDNMSSYLEQSKHRTSLDTQDKRNQGALDLERLRQRGAEQLEKIKAAIKAGDKELIEHLLTQQMRIITNKSKSPEERDIARELLKLGSEMKDRWAAANLGTTYDPNRGPVPRTREPLESDLLTPENAPPKAALPKVQFGPNGEVIGADGKVVQGVRIKNR